MKRIVMLVIGVVAFTYSYAQQRAITERGKEVVLYDDGTWAYLYEEDALNSQISTNSNEFKRDKKSSFLLKSNRISLGFYLDPKEWSFQKSSDNPDVEYDLQLRSEDLYAMIITERIEVPLETLRTIALENGRQVAPDLKIVKEEYRMVNGLKVLLLQMEGSFQGIKATYYGYYYSNENGTVQLVTFTAQNLFPDFKATSEKLLNGMVLLD